MFRRNNNVISRRGKPDLIILIGVVPFRKIDNSSSSLLFFVHMLVFIRTRSSSRKFNIRHFSFELGFVSLRFISLAFFVAGEQERDRRLILLSVVSGTFLKRTALEPT